MLGLKSYTSFYKPLALLGMPIVIGQLGSIVLAFAGFFSLIIPLIVVGAICWKVTRKDLQFVYEERSRDFFLIHVLHAADLAGK